MLAAAVRPAAADTTAEWHECQEGPLAVVVAEVASGIEALRVVARKPEEVRHQMDLA